MGGDGLTTAGLVEEVARGGGRARGNGRRRAARAPVRSPGAPGRVLCGHAKSARRPFRLRSSPWPARRTA